MKCDGCKFAHWQRTSNGRMHPNKAGRCRALETKPLDLSLPAAFYWLLSHQPSPEGGHIDRGREIKDCAWREEGDAP